MMPDYDMTNDESISDPHGIDAQRVEIDALQAKVEGLEAQLANAQDGGYKRADCEGFERGVRLYAWWKDGVEYVGSGVHTLKDALVAAIAVEAKCASRRDAKRAALRKTGEQT